MRRHITAVARSKGVCISRFRSIAPAETPEGRKAGTSEPCDGETHRDEPVGDAPLSPVSARAGWVDRTAVTHRSTSNAARMAGCRAASSEPRASRHCAARASRRRYSIWKSTARSAHCAVASAPAQKPAFPDGDRGECYESDGVAAKSQYEGSRLQHCRRITMDHEVPPKAVTCARIARADKWAFSRCGSAPAGETHDTASGVGIGRTLPGGRPHERTGHNRNRGSRT